MNQLQIKIYHYTCKNYDNNIDGVPEFVPVNQDQVEVIKQEEYTHLMCTNCDEKIAVVFEVGEG